MQESGEEAFIHRRDIDEAEKSIERGEQEDPFFQLLERQFAELKGEEADDPVLLTRQEKERELTSETPHQNLRNRIKEWENAHRDYVPQNIDRGKVSINNYSQQELSWEFIDFLIGNAAETLRDNDILQHIGKINIAHVTGKNDGVILSVANEDGKVLNLFFSGKNEFALAHAQEAKKIYPA